MITIQVSLDQSDYDQLQTKANDCRLSTSATARMLIVDGLKKKGE